MDEDDTVVVVEGDTAPPDDGDTVQTVIVAESDDKTDDVAAAVSVEHRLTVLETGYAELSGRISDAQFTADIADMKADDALEVTEDVAEEIAPVAAEVAAEVVENTEIIEDGEVVEEVELDAPDPAPRSSAAHWLFADHPFRDRKRD